MRGEGLKQQPCLGCGKMLDGRTFVATIETNSPSRTAISLCIGCGHIMGYNEDDTFRELTGEEIVALAGHPTILRIQKLRAHYMEAMKRKRDPDDEYSVYQFFPDGSNERVRSFVSAEEAKKAVQHYCTSVGAQLGVTRRVIITDGGDFICWEWQHGKGITFPPRQQ